MRNFLGKLLLIIFGFSLSFFILEIGLRLFSPQIFAVHPPGLYSVDPDVGYVLTPDFQGELVRPEFDTVVTTNRAGLRGPELRTRQENTWRILLLGDSQTWGFGVDDDETYAINLEALLQEQFPELDIQVLNGGVPGYGTVDQLHFLQARIEKLDPDLVVVQFLSVNDLQENRAPANEWATIVDGLLAHRDPAAGEEAMPTLERVQRWLKGHSHLARLVLDVSGYWATRAGLLADVDSLWGEDFTDEDRQKGIRNLVEIAETAAAHSAETLFLYTTAQVDILPATYSPPRSRGVVAAAAQQGNVVWIDGSAALSQHPRKESLYYAQNGHWTAAGHRAIAEIVAAAIIENGLVEGR